MPTAPSCASRSALATAADDEKLPAHACGSEETASHTHSIDHVSSPPAHELRHSLRSALDHSETATVSSVVPSQYAPASSAPQSWFDVEKIASSS